MRILTTLLVGGLFLAGCGGKLSDEQRKKLKDGMEAHKIKQVTDSEIVTAALEKGRTAFKALEDLKFDLARKDQLASQYQMKMRWIVPGSPDAMEVENQIIQAYIIGSETGATQDNIQKISQKDGVYDSLLYSHPVASPQPDGSVNVKGVWNFYMSKKDVILGIDQ